MKHTVITIARSYGSGGRTLGKKLAEELGIHCYDRELIRMASDESGINEALFGEADEKLRKMPLFRIAKKAYHGEVLPPDSDEFVSNDNLFNYQAKIIREVAKEESCIIIGRCADYVLENENVDVLSVFVYGSVDYRAKRVMSALDITQAKAKDKVLKTDKQRRTYYDYYTSKNWGVMSNYDLCIDAEKFGIEETANMIINAAKKKIK